MLQAWEQKDDGAFQEGLCDRGKGIFVNSEAMVNVSALRASHKLILRTYILSQLPA